jgi:hypothetical protein
MCNKPLLDLVLLGFSLIEGIYKGTRFGIAKRYIIKTCLNSRLSSL